MFATFTTLNGDVSINPAMIVSVRPSLKSEMPGKSVIATLDCKIHIVQETIEEVREIIEMAKAST